jgi:hypothetical protein
MKEINLKVSGSLGSTTRKPLLVPSYNGTGITATQSGFVVTVDFNGVAHNIDSTAGMISNVGVDVYLKFATGAIVGDLLGTPTNEIYNNITVTSTTTFTCLSRVSATVSTPQAVTQGLNTFKAFQTSGLTIPANTFQVGSMFRVSGVVLTPATPATRNLTLGGVPSTYSINSGFFWNDNTAAATRLQFRYVSLVQFLSGGADPTLMVTDNTTGNSTTVQPLKILPGQYMDMAAPIVLCHTVNFNNVMLNDYALLFPMTVELIA